MMVCDICSRRLYSMSRLVVYGLINLVIAIEVIFDALFS
jgi:hypothetical protein